MLVEKNHLIAKTDTVVPTGLLRPGLLHFAIFCQIFEKNTPKNTTKPGNFPRTVTLF